VLLAGWAIGRLMSVVVPFVIAILRYALVVDQGGGGAPEEVVLSDRTLQIIGIIWLATFALGVRG
jgi:decaprenyl-phosphate phosphoribosyltransferase